MQATDNATLRLQAHTKVLRLMGNRFAITAVAGDEALANSAIEKAVAEIKRIEQLLTTFNNSSQTNCINQNAGISPVNVDEEVFRLVQHSIKLSHLTQGAFDITYGSVDKDFWNFNKGMKKLPDAVAAKQTVKLVNFRNIILDEKDFTVFLKEKGMRIGFGGIGKGYAADRAKLILQQNGIESGVVNAAGDLITWGFQPGGKPWTIGIADPGMAGHAFSSLNITNAAIATSGNYEKFVVINGIRYSHTINPKTGMPVSGIRSVTVIGPTAEVADAMATPVMVMGVKVGLNLINQVNGIECIIVDDNNKIFTSSNITII